MNTIRTVHRPSLIVHRFGVFLLLALSCTQSPPPSRITLDDLHRPVALPRHVNRVITLAPNLTEIVCALGSRPKLIGVDDNSDFPREIAGLPRVGGMQPNIEKIVALKPDLVLASTQGNHPNLAPALAAAHIPLYVAKTDHLVEIARAIDRIGEVLESPNRAGVVAAVRDGLQRAKRRRTHPPRVLFVVWTNPLYVSGHDTFADELLTLCGARNAVPDGVKGWPQLSLESLVAAPPDLLIYPDREVTPAQVGALLDAAPGVRGKTDVRGVDENVFTRPGPRVVEAAAILNEILDRKF